jgi:lipopolysaccharide export system permease protein
MVEMLFRFERQRLNIDMNPSTLGSEVSRPDEMNLRELYLTMKNAEQKGNDAARLAMYFYLRIAVPWASVVLALVGATVGSRPQRSSSGMGLGLSVVIVFCYYVIMSLCRSMGEYNFIPGLVAAWIPNAVFLTVGLFLVRRANRLG